MEVQELKVGDVVILEYYERYSNYKSYKKRLVERLTNKFAVLNKGEYIDRISNNGMFSQKGDRWTKWALATPELIKLHKDYSEKVKISNWWYKFKENATYNQIVMIYSLINK